MFMNAIDFDVLNADSDRYADALISHTACDGCNLLSPSSAIHSLRKTWITKQYTSLELSSPPSVGSGAL